MNALPRLVEPALAERLRVMPAVAVTGARQTGKSTLAAERVAGRRRYVSLDDLDVLDAARRDPEVLAEGAVNAATRLHHRDWPCLLRFW